MIWAQALPEGTSAQKAELIALTKPLELAKDKKAIIYTDSRYAFATAHVHGAIHQQQGLLTSGGKEIKTKPEILALLGALMGPAEVNIIHCRGHQRGNSLVARGNNQADQEAWIVALGKVPVMALEDSNLADPKIKYTAEDLALITKNCDNWFNQKTGIWHTLEKKKFTW